MSLKKLTTVLSLLLKQLTVIFKYHQILELILNCRLSQFSHLFRQQVLIGLLLVTSLLPPLPLPLYSKQQSLLFQSTQQQTLSSTLGSPKLVLYSTTVTTILLKESENMSLSCSKPQMTSHCPWRKVICAFCSLSNLIYHSPTLTSHFLLVRMSYLACLTSTSCYCSDTPVLFHLGAFLLSIAWNAFPLDLCTNTPFLHSGFCSSVTPSERSSLTSSPSLTFFFKCMFCSVILVIWHH